VVKTVRLVTNSLTTESVAAEMLASTPKETPTVTEVCKAIDVQRNVTNDIRRSILTERS